MGHKYLKDIGVCIENTPYGFGGDKDPRNKDWEQEKEIYGFDNRETWCMDVAFYCWLYERLMMFNEVNIINTNFHTIDINDRKLTLQQCIDEMIEGCKVFLTTDDYYYSATDEERKKVDNVLVIWKECISYMWW